MSNSNMRDMQHQYTRPALVWASIQIHPLLKKFEEVYGRKPMWDEVHEMTRTGKVPPKPDPEGWDL